MRNCNTLPLSSNPATMKKFLRGTSELIERGNTVLIYAEQSMWYNYRKPKPLKIGAYQMAVRSGVPIIPAFITMADSERLDADGLPIQEHTVHIGKPIFPDLTLPRAERAEKMRDENFAFNREIYESVYGIPLTYES